MAMPLLYSQNQSVTFTENFDGNNSTFTSSPATARRIDANDYVSTSDSIWETVPNIYQKIKNQITKSKVK
jgi:hypothetical protein